MKNQFRLFTLVLGTLLVASPLMALEIRGKVVESRGDVVTVEPEGQFLPGPGDKVDIVMEVPGLDDVATIASGRVAQVSGDLVVVKIDRATGQIEKDQLARIVSESPQTRVVSQLRETRSPEGRFRILMPGVPRVETQALETTTITRFAVDRGDKSYRVAFSDQPVSEGESYEQLQERLDRGRDAIGGVVFSETQLVLNGQYPGREVAVALPNDEYLRVRMYWVGTRLYQVVVSGSRAWITSDEATRFLDSFALTDG